MRRLLVAGLIALGSAANAAAQSSTVTYVAFMQLDADVAAVIRPEHFERSRRTPAEIDAFMALQKKASSAFTQDESQEAFTLQGRYLRQQ
jgi:hypothetical protein